MVEDDKNEGGASRGGSGAERQGGWGEGGRVEG